MAADGGTESLRVGIFDTEGHLVAQDAKSYQTSYPRSGWAEQDPDDWWGAFVHAARGALGSSDIGAAEIVALCTDATTCTLVAVDSAFRHLRPALLWMDVRAAEQASRIHGTGHPALCYSMSGVNAEWMLPKVLWLKENEPELYDKTANFFEYQDWLAYRLTGRLVLNQSTSSLRWFYNNRTWKWPLDLWESVGLSDLIEKIPTEVIPAGKPIGHLSERAAEELGLSPSVQVIQGGGDAFVALPGLGITEPGRVGLIAGSSNVLAGFTAKEVHGKGILGAYPDVIMPGLWLVEGGQVSTGSILAWFKRHFAADLPEESAYDSLNREAAALKPGSGGLIALDYFQGNRTPYTDSMARGALWGLSLHTSRAHVYRALMEGIAYGTHHGLQTISSMGDAVTAVTACGGATKSELYMGILSDVCGVPISITEVSEASLLGCAVAAAAGVGLYRDTAEASRRMVRITRTYEPNRPAHEAYQFYFGLYRETYPQLKDLMHRMNRRMLDEVVGG